MSKVHWRMPSIRAVTYQMVAVIAVTAIIYFFAQNTLQNIERHGLNTGFEFLSRDSNFRIDSSFIDYEGTLNYWQVYIVGLLNTLFISALGIILATTIGAIVGVACLSNNWLVAKVALIYGETIRNIPFILQLMCWYFGGIIALPNVRNGIEIGESIILNNRGLYFPRLITEQNFFVLTIAVIVFLAVLVGIIRWIRNNRKRTGHHQPAIIIIILLMPIITVWTVGSLGDWEYPTVARYKIVGGVHVMPELIAFLLALSIYISAYVAETLRSGIRSFNPNQVDAAKSLGLKSTDIMHLIIIPQGVRAIIPSLANHYLNLVRISSLGAVIGYPGLHTLFAGTTLNQTGQILEIIAMIIAVYLTINLIGTFLIYRYNSCAAMTQRFILAPIGTDIGPIFCPSDIAARNVRSHSALDANLSSMR